MIVAIHQPHYLPWLGYLHRMAQVDLFIVLDHVQFERRNYQNRSQIRLDGEARWLTVPVVQRSQKDRITDKRVDNSDPRPWGADPFSDAAPRLSRGRAFRRLRGRATRNPRYALGAPGRSGQGDARVPARRARDPHPARAQLRARRAGREIGADLNLCRAVGADALLAGFGGSRGYLDIEAFAREGVSVQWHEFNHPAYRQCGPQPFIPGLAALDLLFNCGPQSRALLMDPAAGEALRAAA